MNAEGKPEPNSQPTIETQDATGSQPEPVGCADPNCEACRARRRHEFLDKRTDRLALLQRVAICLGFTKLGVLLTITTFQIGVGLGQMGVITSIGATALIGLWARSRFRADCHEMGMIESRLQPMPFPFPMVMRLPPGATGGPRQPPTSGTPPAKA